MKHTYTVVGLGVFGSTIALELSRLGNDVIGIDLNPNLVSDIADRITQAVIADARDEKVLRDLGVHGDRVTGLVAEDLVRPPRSSLASQTRAARGRARGDRPNGLPRLRSTLHPHSGADRLHRPTACLSLPGVAPNLARLLSNPRRSLNRAPADAMVPDRGATNLQLLR